MRRPLGVVDEGPAPARWNLAYDQALVEAHRAGRVGDLVRFVRFPRSAIVGRHQNLAREVDVAWCSTHGVEVARRITGGGAIWMEPAILGFGLLLDRQATAPDLATAAARIGSATAAGLRQLGIAARFRPRNDIEVDGRKLGGTGGFFDGRTLLFHGTVLVDLDLDAMAKALVLPAAKLERRGLAAVAERLTTLRALLGEVLPMERVKAALLAGWSEGLGLDPRPLEPPPELAAEVRWIHDAEIGTDDFVDEVRVSDGSAWRSGEHQAAGGTIRAHLRLRPGASVIQDIMFEGDFFIAPPRAVPDLEAALKDVPLASAPAVIRAFLARAPEVTMLGLTPEDLAAAVTGALDP